HQTLVLLLPGITYLLIKRPGKTFLPFTLYLLPAFLIGFSVYLFLPIRSAQNPTANWGAPADSFRNFYRVLTRADYGGVRLHPEKSPTEQNFSTVIKNFVNFLSISIESKNGWAVATIFFLGAGIYSAFRKKLFWTLFLFWFFSGPVFFIISNLPLTDRTSLPILEPYLIMPLIVFTIFIALGYFHGILSLSRFIGDKIVIFVISAGMCGIILFNLPQSSKRYEFIGYDYSKDLLKTLPNNSILFNPDDTTTFTLKYQQDCIRRRQDVRLAVFYKTLWGYGQLKKKYPEILPDYEMKSGIELEAAILSYNFNRFPFYSDNISKIPPNYKITPFGILYGNSDISSSEKMFDFYVLPCRTFGKNRFFTNQIINYYSAGYNNLGLVFNEKKLYNKSVPLFEKAISVDPSLSQAYNNLGVVYWEKMDYAKASEYFSQALKNAPNDEGVKRNLFIAQEKLKDKK
ncbi:MAG: tetratricopeptide repeat protein, partial [Elusimicrobiota bacterium]|nr:tetratricopeptide repeat protein [Elusimicrobiota bacterium]